MFTRDQIEEIKKKLIMLGTKDTQFPDAYKLNGEEIVAIVQDGENRKIPLSSIINDDFINVSKYTTEILTLSTAVSKIDINNRKLGQIITFKDSANSWAIRQFTGSSLDNWNDISLWKSISGIDELKSQADTNTSNLSSLNTEVSAMQSKVDENTTSISQINNNIADNNKSIAQINTTLDEHTESINARITTDRIADGAVTTEKIATSAFDSTLSVSGKIAPADVVGEKITELEGAMRDFCSGMFTENKVINAQGQEVVMTNLYCTGFLPVKNRILAYGYEGATYGYHICSFYDKDKVFISSYVGASVPTYMAIDLSGDDIPSNAYYFRINSFVKVIDKSYAVGDVQDFLVSFIEEYKNKISNIEMEIESLDVDGIRTDISVIEEILNIGTEAVDVAAVNEKTNAYVNNTNRSMQNLGHAYSGKIYKVAFYPIVRGTNYQLVIPKTGLSAAFMNAAYTNDSNPEFSQAVFTNVDGSKGDDSAKTLNFIAEDYSFVAVSYAYSNEDGSVIYGNPSLSFTREKNDSVTEMRGEIDSINPDPRIILPSKIYAAVGVEFNLYKDAIVLGIDKGLASPVNFSVEIVSNVGNDYERVYSLTPISSQVGEHPIVINVYNSNRKLVATKTSSLVVIDNVAPASVKNILMIGDSTLDLGDVTTTLIGDFVGNAPKTWGANTRQFPLLNQGIGGWGVVNYTERGSVYKMYATDYKLYTSAKQSGVDLRTHSVYKNETDTQRIEIYQVFTDKFQYVVRKGTPVSGTYTKVSGNGDNTLTLDIISPEYGNPFWNPDSNTLDLAYYKSRIGFNGSFDVVTMRMGINDSIFKNIHSDADFEVTLNRYKSLVDLFVADGAKVIVELPLTDVSDHDAWGVKGAGSANTAGKNIYQADMWRWREAIIKTFDNGAYGNNVEVGCAGLCVDRWYGYSATGTIVPVMPGKVATRLGVTSLMHNNSVHPNNGGYMQLADALYPQLLRLLI